MPPRDFLLLVERSIISTIGYNVGGAVSGSALRSIIVTTLLILILGLAVSMTK